MRGDGVISVSEIPSPRRNIAIEQLEQGRGFVVLDSEVVVALRRWPTGPRPDHRLQVAIYSTNEPRRISQEMAAREVALGLQTYRSVLEADARLAVLVEKNGSAIEYLHDYGMGAVLVGTVSPDGSLSWSDSFAPEDRR